MSNGELPTRATMAAYYKLENLNDSSGNGRTLINDGSVPFNPAKFKNGADFGSSGTTKALHYDTANILSTLTPSVLTISFWVKLNDTTLFNANAGLVHLSTRLTIGTGAARIVTFYNLTTTFDINFANVLSVTNSSVIVSIPKDTKWHHCVLMITSTTDVVAYVDGVFKGSNTGSGVQNNNAILSYLSIGNRNAASFIQQAFTQIDEVIIEERAWTASEIRKYYTQGLGRLAPSMVL